MTRRAILGAGAVILALLAAICIPRHLPTSTVSSSLTPANFHAHFEQEVLTLRGSLPNETSKAAILQRAQELYGAGSGRVVDELAVDPTVGPAAWTDNIPQVLPILRHMMEHGSIIIDGRTIVLSGRVDNDRTKATVLGELVPLAQTGLELEDRLLTNPSPAGPSPKAPLPTAPSKKAPSSKAPSPMAIPPPKALSLPVAPALAAPSLAEAPTSPLQQKLNEILSHASIEFDSNTITITPRSRATLDQLITQLRDAPSRTIEIGGHTDKYGEPNYNLELSHRRAEAVQQYFISHGLTNQFTAVGYGASRPLSAAQTRIGLQQNRRIELRVKGERDL